jgi:hypothetical protein
MRLAAIAARKVPKGVAISIFAIAVACCGCVAFTTATVPSAHAADANYQLIQEPDAGYSAIITLTLGPQAPARHAYFAGAVTVSAAVIDWDMNPRSTAWGRSQVDMSTG